MQELEGRCRQLEERVRQGERESAEREELQQLLRSQLEHVKQLGLDLATQLQVRNSHSHHSSALAAPNTLVQLLMIDAVWMR